MNDQTQIRARLLRLIGEKAGGKKQELAQMMGIQASLLSRFINGHERITRRYLIKAEQATGARLIWLENGIEPVYYAPDQMPERAQAEWHEGAQLRAYLEKIGMEHTELSRMIGKAKTTIQGYFNSETLNPANKKAILTALNVPESAVFGGISNQSNSIIKLNDINTIDEINSSLVAVLFIPASVRAGSGYLSYFSPSMKQESIRVQPTMLQPGVPAERHVIIEVNRDSMEPQLATGFKMLAYQLEPGTLPKLNSIVLVDYRGELLIKELSEIDDVAGAIVLRASNGGATRKILVSEIKAIYHIYRYFDAKLTL